MLKDFFPGFLVLKWHVDQDKKNNLFIAWLGYLLLSGLLGCNLYIKGSFKFFAYQDFIIFQFAFFQLYKASVSLFFIQTTDLYHGETAMAQ